MQLLAVQRRIRVPLFSERSLVSIRRPTLSAGTGELEVRHGTATTASDESSYIRMDLYQPDGEWDIIGQRKKFRVQFLSHFCTTHFVTLSQIELFWPMASSVQKPIHWNLYAEVLSTTAAGVG